MLFEEKALMETTRECRRRCRDWETADLQKYHEKVETEINTQLANDVHMKVSTKQRYIDRRNFTRSLSSLSRKSSALFASRNTEYCEILKEISKAKDTNVTPTKKKTDIFRGPARQPASTKQKRERVYDIIINEFAGKTEAVASTLPRVKRARKVMALYKATGVRNMMP